LSQASGPALITINAGIQFDPDIVEVFTTMMRPEQTEEYHSILRLATAVGRSEPTLVATVAEAAAHLEQA